MRTLLILAIASFITVNAAPHEFDNNKVDLKALLDGKKIDSNFIDEAIKLLARHEGDEKVQRHALAVKSLLHRGLDLTGSAAPDSQPGTKLIGKIQDKLSKLKSADLLTRYPLPADFKFPEQLHMQSKPQISKTIKQLKIAQPFKVPESIQLPENFQKKN